MFEILALDIGYGYTKGAIFGKRAVVIPSLVGAYERIDFESTIIRKKGSGIAIEIDGRTLFVGDYASLQSGSVAQTLDVTRTGSVEQLALFYALASELIKTNTTEVKIVTGLPVADFDKRNRAALTKMLKGDHVIRRKDKMSREFRVTDVYIVPQAMGALFSLVLDKHGKLVNGGLAGGRVGIVDVGMLTTNFVLSDRLRYVAIGCDSIENGMSEVLTRVAKDLKREYGLDWNQKLSKVDRAVRVKGKLASIEHLVTPYIEPLAETVISRAHSLWGEAADVDAIVLAGGGSHELVEYVRQIYPHTQTVGSNSQLANVIGFLRAGLRQFPAKAKSAPVVVEVETEAF